MDLAFYDLKLHKGRFIATIIGVGLLFTIVLAMNGLYRGNIYEGLAVIKATNPDLWVVERHRGGPFNEQSTLAEALLLQCPGNSRGGEGLSLYLLYRGAPDRQQEPTFQHHRLRCLRRPGRPSRKSLPAGALNGPLRNGGRQKTGRRTGRPGVPWASIPIRWWV